MTLTTKMLALSAIILDLNQGGNLFLLILIHSSHSYNSAPRIYSFISSAYQQLPYDNFHYAVHSSRGLAQQSTCNQLQTLYEGAKQFKTCLCSRNLCSRSSQLYPPITEILGVHKKLGSSWIRPRPPFSKSFNGLLLGWILQMYYRLNLKSVALPVLKIIGGSPKNYGAQGVGNSTVGRKQRIKNCILTRNAPET